MVATVDSLRRLSEADFERVESHPAWQKYRGKCPTCEGTGRFRYQDVEHDCPDDDYGHVRLRLFMAYLAANIPEQYQVLQWDEFPEQNKHVKEAVSGYLDNFESFYSHGMGLEFLSKLPGTGKTWAATHVLRELVKRGYRGWFVDFAQMKSYHELDDREERIWKTRMLREVPILVIDDVRRPWSDKSEGFFGDKLEEVVRERTNNNLVNIITSNMEDDEMAERFPRVVSLLEAKTWASEVLVGPDARKGIAYETNEALAMMGERRPIT